MVKKGLLRKGDGLHVDHKNNNSLDNSPSNLRGVAAKPNLQKKEKKVLGLAGIGWEMTRNRWHVIFVRYGTVL
jgi:hypothetical protein